MGPRGGPLETAEALVNIRLYGGEVSLSYEQGTPGTSNEGADPGRRSNSVRGVSSVPIGSG